MLCIRWHSIDIIEPWSSRCHRDEGKHLFDEFDSQRRILFQSILVVVEIFKVYQQLILLMGFGGSLLCLPFFRSAFLSGSRLSEEYECFVD